LSEFTKEREYFYRERLKNLNAFSKNFSFDNPETKYINDLINRIKEGMEYVKLQEKKEKPEIKEKNKNVNSHCSEPLIKNDNSMKNFEQKCHEQKKSSNNTNDDLLKNYNRSGSFNEILKKIKRKNYPIKSNIKDDRKYENKNSFKKAYKKCSNQQSKSEIQFNKDDNNNSQSITLKSYQKIIINNNNLKFCNNHSSNDNITKNENNSKSVINSKVKKLFSHIRSVSAYDKKMDQHKDNQDSIKKDFSFVHNDNNSINLSLKDSSINSPTRQIISSFNSNFLKKNDSTNFGEWIINRNNSSFKTFLNSANKKHIKLEKDKCYYQKLVKRNSSFFSYKAKIKNTNKKESKNDHMVNSSMKTIDFSLNSDSKDEKVIHFNKTNNFFNKKIDQINSQINNLNKTTNLKSEEKTKLNTNSITNNNTNIHIKFSTNNQENSETINSNLYSNRMNFIDVMNNKKETFNSLEGKMQIILDPLNKEIGGLNNEIYIFKKNDEKQPQGKIQENLLNSKIKNFKAENQKRLNMEKSRNLIFNNDKNSTYEILAANQEEIERNQKAKIIKLDHSSKNDCSIRGISTVCENPIEIDKLNLKEFWRAKRSEIFNRSEKKNEINKNSIINSKINLNFTQNKDKCEIKDLFYLNHNNSLRSKPQCINNNDIQLNVNLFIKENFKKENSLFNNKGIKTLLECSELNKNIFINSDKISNILNKKYDLFKKLNLNVKPEEYIKKTIMKNK